MQINPSDILELVALRKDNVLLKKEIERLKIKLEEWKNKESRRSYEEAC